MMVNKKSLLEFLDEVSKGRGFEKFSNSTDVGKVYVVEEIIKEAGKRYVKQYLDIAAENAMLSVDGEQEECFTCFGVGGDSSISVSSISITNIEIDI